MAKNFTELSTRVVKSSVDWTSDGLQLADMLAARFTYRTRADWEDRIASGEITVNAKPAHPDQILHLHDIIEYRPSDIVEPPADLDYRTVYEDDLLLVIDKPGNLCIHPAGPFFKHTLWHLLCTKYGSIHFLNRLDRETSGLLIAAKDPQTAAKLSKSKSISAKNYQVIVHGCFDKDIHASGFLLNAGGAVRKKRKFVNEMPQNPPFESADTRFTALIPGEKLSLVGAELGTGRMHQIRATLCSLGFPVAGDKLYGLDDNFYLKQKSDELTADDRAALLISRQALHCCDLAFRHPANGETLEFHSPLPAELAELINNGE